MDRRNARPETLMVTTTVMEKERIWGLEMATTSGFQKRATPPHVPSAGRHTKGWREGPAISQAREASIADNFVS